MPSDRYRLSGTYERLRRTLLELPNSAPLDKTLGYWVQPADRRLPIVFLDQTLRQLLSLSIEELMSTPGVGEKKILGFFDLLRRAAKSSHTEPPFGLTSSTKPAGTAVNAGVNDCSAVSEAVWSTWCETINRCGYRDEHLGRLAPSLQTLPTVIWRSPLANYADLTLADIRQLKTHGQKRVEAILEIFCTIHEAVSTAVLTESIDIRLAPRFIAPVTQWLIESSSSSTSPSWKEVQHHIVDPLTSQVANDLGPTVANLVTGRLSQDPSAPTVKQQADTLGVTRARIYQLLEDCSKAMEVRWPEGRWLLTAPIDRFDPQHGGTDLLIRVRDLFFSDDRQLANPSSRQADWETHY